jgi:hypothetical protein
MLRDSDRPAVANLYAHLTDSKDTIDSTIGTLLIALDRLTYAGEGYLVMNASTYDKWIERATVEEPWAAIFQHLWACVRINGPIWQDQITGFDTAVLYFSARTSTRLTAQPFTLTSLPSHDAIATVCHQLKTVRHEHYHGGHAYQNSLSEILPRWDAIRDEITRTKEDRPSKHNIFLDKDGYIRRYLSTYEQFTNKIDGKLLRKLDQLEGKRPMQLVVQTISRVALLHALKEPAWSVDPALMRAVTRAIASYEDQRAPFFQPNDVQALGWIDEHDTIKCRVPLPGSIFQADHSYRLTTTTESTQWTGEKTNDLGTKDRLILSGAELLVNIHEGPADKATDPDGNPYATHAFHVRAENADTQENYPPDTPYHKHHHITALVDHFHTPRPQDIAQLNPDAYQANLTAITAIETLITNNLAQ